MASDPMAALRAYVLAGERAVNQGTILLDFRHSNLQRNLSEIAFHAENSLLDVKERLYRMTGTSPGAMLLSHEGRQLVGDDTLLGSLELPKRALIHVLDTDPQSISRDGGLDDDSRIQKYEMSEEDYNARENTVRAWKRRQQEQEQRWKLTHQHLAEKEKQQQEQQNQQGGDANPSKEDQKQETMEEVRQRIKVGDRCEVSPGARRGEVVYVGPVPELPGNQLVWIGVNFDWPVGRGDGCVGGLRGRRYFQALPNHGGFLKPQAVKVGDYPNTLTLSSSDDDDDDVAAAAGQTGHEEELFEDI